MDTFASKNYLAHYGVKGMKWGVRKTLEARKSLRKAGGYEKGENWRKTNDLYRAKLRKFYDDAYDTVEKSKDRKKAIDDVTKQERELINKGCKAVKKAILMDLGYSKEEAEIGAKWMVDNGFNMRFGEDDGIYSVVYEWSDEMDAKRRAKGN